MVENTMLLAIENNKHNNIVNRSDQGCTVVDLWSMMYRSKMHFGLSRKCDFSEWKTPFHIYLIVKFSLTIEPEIRHT